MNRRDVNPEQARLEELKRLCIMDSPEEKAYDDITRLAADLCGTPFALITLIDAKRQWFKSRVGLQLQETPVEDSFCAVAMRSAKDVLVINDTLADPRFVANPLVTGDPNFRFYAGARLVTAAGHPIGALCVLDSSPRQINARQLEDLWFLSRQVVALLEGRSQGLA